MINDSVAQENSAEIQHVDMQYNSTEKVKLTFNLTDSTNDTAKMLCRKLMFLFYRKNLQMCAI